MSTCQLNDTRSNGPSLKSDTCPLASLNDNGDYLSSNPSVSCVDQAGVVEDPPEPEILGSVVHSHEYENGDKNSSVQLRTSARVSKKMRLDFIANQAPPERKGRLFFTNVCNGK